MNCLPASRTPRSTEPNGFGAHATPTYPADTGTPLIWLPS
jgi:hypothetical protein